MSSPQSDRVRTALNTLHARTEGRWRREGDRRDAYRVIVIGEFMDHVPGEDLEYLLDLLTTKDY